MKNIKQVAAGVISAFMLTAANAADESLIIDKSVTNSNETAVIVDASSLSRAAANVTGSGNSEVGPIANTAGVGPIAIKSFGLATTSTNGVSSAVTAPAAPCNEVINSSYAYNLLGTGVAKSKGEQKPADEDCTDREHTYTLETQMLTHLLNKTSNVKGGKVGASTAEHVNAQTLVAKRSPAFAESVKCTYAASAFAGVTGKVDQADIPTTTEIMYKALGIDIHGGEDGKTVVIGKVIEVCQDIFSASDSTSDSALAPALTQ